MTLRRWIALAFLVAAILLVQKLGLEARPETKVEAPFKSLAHLPASDVLPTYIASLFFGAFRAVAIDVLWISLKKVEEERRWYERRQTLTFIAYFQPRNPEVRAHLGWHSAYNVASGFNDEASRQWRADSRAWEWVRFGITWLRDGIAQMPDSVYLKYELAKTLFHKPARSRGRLDLALLKRIEEDALLQKALQDGRGTNSRMSAFELAILWLEQGRDQVMKTAQKHQLTQMGLYIYPTTLDGAIRECHYLQGIYAWQTGDFEEAKAAFRRALEHTEKMVRTDYPEELSPIHQEWIPFYRGLPELVDLEQRSRSGRPEDVRAYLEKLQAHLASGDPTSPPLDDGYLWDSQDASRPLNRLKLAAAGGKDPQECNDAGKLAWPIQPGDLALATLDPPGDVDYYSIFLVPPKSGTGTGSNSPPHPFKIRVFLDRTTGGRMDLKVSAQDLHLRTLAEAEVRGRKELTFEAKEYGIYYVRVEPLSRPDPWPSDTGYKLRYQIGD